jgi:hypothetical protein
VFKYGGVMSEDIQNRLNGLDQKKNPQNASERLVEIVYWYGHFKPEIKKAKETRLHVASAMGLKSHVTINSQFKLIYNALGINYIDEIIGEIWDTLNENLKDLPPVDYPLIDIESEAFYFDGRVEKGPDFSKLDWPPPPEEEPEPQQPSQQEIEDNIIEGLKKLNPIEVTVLKLSYKENLSYSQAAEKLGIRGDNIEAAVKAIETNLPASLLEQTTRDRTVGLLYEVHPDQPTEPPVTPIDPTPQPRPPVVPPLPDRQRRSWGALIVAISLCAICSVSIIVFRLVTRPDDQPPIEATMEAMAQTATPLVAQIPEETDTPIVIVERETVIVEKIVTETPLPATPGPSPTPTVTPTPTDTPTPTPTDTPIPPMVLPFTDNFADDVDDRWSGHNENYIISGGVLKIKDGNVKFILKGPLPEKYNIELGYVHGRYRILLGDQLSLVRNNGTRWEEWRDGKYVKLEGLGSSDTPDRIRIEVDGNVHRLFYDADEEPPLIYNKEPGGDLAIELIPFRGLTGFTDFEITVP